MSTHAYDCALVKTSLNGQKTIKNKRVNTSCRLYFPTGNPFRHKFFRWLLDSESFDAYCAHVDSPSESSFFPGILHENIHPNARGKFIDRGAGYHLKRSLRAVVCNPCQSSPSLTIHVSLWFIIISLVFFYLSKLFLDFLQFNGNFVCG